MTVTLELKPEQEQALKELAERKGVTLSALAQEAIGQYLEENTSDQAESAEIDALITEVVRDNQELYKRLA
jgi:predicted transcriptional regulator